MKLTLSKHAIKYISKQVRKNQDALKDAIIRLPDGSDIKYFSNNDTYRLRVGNFRVLYHIKPDGGIHVDAVGPRGDIYK